MNHEAEPGLPDEDVAEAAEVAADVAPDTAQTSAETAGEFDTKAELEGALESLKKADQALEKDGEGAAQTLTDALVKVYRLKAFQKAEGFWNGLDDRTKAGFAGEGWRGYILGLPVGTHAGEVTIMFTN